MRALLISKLGYAPENILYLIDKPGSDEKTDGPPTAANLRLQIEKFRARFSAREESSFLFYYSGHGGYEKGARKDYGVLQPSGYFENLRCRCRTAAGTCRSCSTGSAKGVPSRTRNGRSRRLLQRLGGGAKGEATLSEGCTRCGRSAPRW